MQRRDLLAAIAGSTALVGCLDGNNPEAPGDGDDDPTIDASLQSTGSDCATPNDDWAAASEAGDGLAIEGTTPAPTPCYEAVLEGTTLAENTVELAVDVTSTLGEDEDCAQCAGAVDYEITVAGDLAGVEGVQVDHVPGQSHTLDVFGADEPPRVDVTAIETRSADCGSADEVSASVTGPFITLHGHLPAPDPCHEAALTDATVEDEILTVDIEAVPDEEAGVCIECLAEVEYQAQVELVGPPAIAEIHVHHADGQDHTFAIE